LVSKKYIILDRKEALVIYIHIHTHTHTQKAKPNMLHMDICRRFSTNKRWIWQMKILESNIRELGDE
jgi:hypothetical protein